MVTAPGGSAESIPFLKTWVNLPGAVAFTVAYSSMANRLGRQALFYSVLGPFLGFFGAFAWIIYPMRNFLHPTQFAAFLTSVLPAGFAAPIAVMQNWTYSLFYLLANMWGSVVVSLLFWGFANEVTTVTEAKKYYPLFGLFANVALVFSGQFVRYVSQLHTSLPVGVDPWGVALKLLMTSVVVLGGVIAGCFRYLNVAVLDKVDAGQLDVSAPKTTKKKKPSMSFGESAKYLASSKYIRNLATLVIAYGMSINLVEVTWKGKLKQAFPNPTDYSAFMGSFSSATGVITLFMMLFGRFVFRKWGWGTAAMITPVTLLVTGVAFFALCLAGNTFAPLLAACGTTPLMVAVFVGAAQNIASKAAKYSVRHLRCQKTPHGGCFCKSLPPKRPNRLTCCFPSRPLRSSSTPARRWPTFPWTPNRRPRARPQSTSSVAPSANLVAPLSSRSSSSASALSRSRRHIWQSFSVP